MSAESTPPSRTSAKPLRILVVNWLDRENPRAGGAETHLHEIFGRLSARGHEVTALVSGWAGAADRARLDAIDVHRTGSRYTFSWAAPRYFHRHLRAEGFDIVVEDLNKVPLFTPWWGGPPTLLLTHHLFGATAFRAASWPVAAATWLLERPIPRVYREVPVVAVSQSTRTDLAIRGLDPGHITVVPNGIDVSRFAPDPHVTRFERPTLVFVGRLNGYKRVDLVLRALARLRAAGREIDFLVAGAGQARDALERLSGELDLDDQVRFLGYVSEARKIEIMQRSWLHVLTSSKEGWGISNIEAAGCGTPTVASDVPGLRESVVDGRTGVLVPHGRVEALAAAIASLLDDPEGRRVMGSQARSFAEAFSWDAAADGFEHVLRRVVADSGGG